MKAALFALTFIGCAGGGPAPYTSFIEYEERSATLTLDDAQVEFFTRQLPANDDWTGHTPLTNGAFTAPPNLLRNGLPNVRLRPNLVGVEAMRVDSIEGVRVCFESITGIEDGRGGVRVGEETRSSMSTLRADATCLVGWASHHGLEGDPLLSDATLEIDLALDAPRTLVVRTIALVFMTPK